MWPEAPRQTRHYLESAAKREPLRQAAKTRNSLLQLAQLFLRSMNDSKFGFSSFAEQWNGRLAMMGFVIGLGTELLTGQGILSQIGLG